MAWMVGIDEAGYGPNLGPFVMSSIACQVPDTLIGGDLWTHLKSSVRRGVSKKADDRVLVDDSKVVYSSESGLVGLERGVFGLLGRDPARATLNGMLQAHCAEGFDELEQETWYVGAGAVPAEASPEAIDEVAAKFTTCCSEGDVADWTMRTVVVATPRFNALLDKHGSKGAVLAHALGVLLKQYPHFAGDGPIHVFVDKHGGRNTYAAMLQDAFDAEMVWAREEGALKSTYQVQGLERPIHVTFQPRADATHFCVALASMVSKYFRERLMQEFNAFWKKHLPELVPTAGYPTDATRFLDEIRATAKRLGIEESMLWRRK